MGTACIALSAALAAGLAGCNREAGTPDKSGKPDETAKGKLVLTATSSVSPPAGG